MSSSRTSRSRLSHSARTRVPANRTTTAYDSLERARSQAAKITEDIPTYRLLPTYDPVERARPQSARATDVPAYRLAATPNLLEKERQRRFNAYDTFATASQMRWSPGVSSNQSSYNLDPGRYGYTNSHRLSDHGRMKMADLTVEDIDILNEKLSRRLDSLTRCISDFKKQQWSPNIENYQSKLMEDTYHAESQITPPWFRALFMDGPRTFDLIPTFPDDLVVTSTEYQELSEASFKITMSFIDSLCGIHGGLFVSEKLTPNFKTNFDLYDAVSFYGSNNFHRNSQSALPSSTAIYSNQSGIILQPINNNPSDWLSNYCYTAMPKLPIYKRRVILEGKFKIQSAISSFEKLFRIIFILDKNDDVKGIYRRQMTSENNFLTWKIILN